MVGAPAMVRRPARADGPLLPTGRAHLIAEFFPAYLADTRARPHQLAPPLGAGRAAAAAAARTIGSLHLDAFTSQPVAGRRILRVFSNVDPTGAERDWAIAEGGFEDYAHRFRHRARRLLPGEAALLEGCR